MSDVNMIDWVKKSGQKIQTNDTLASINAAEGHGWKRADADKKVKKDAYTDKKA